MEAAAEVFGDVIRRKHSFSKLRRRLDLAPATKELQQIFALRRILLKHGKRTEEECIFVRNFIGERTTMWREPFWALLTHKQQLSAAQCVKLRMVPNEGEPHDFVAANSTSGCMIFAALKGLAQVQCFDSTGTRLEFHPSESFGFLPVPEFLMEDAVRKIESIKSNSRSKVYRGEREYGERRQIVADSGKIRVKVAPDGQYLSISGSDILSMLNKAAEKHGRRNFIKSMGLELPGMEGFGGEGGGGGGGGANGRKREMLMREARYGVGSILVEEGAPPTTVFVVVEGECRIIKGKPRTNASGPKIAGRSARYNLGSGQGSKVAMVLTSGFHTQVDVCQLGSLGPKAMVGDIPSLLGGSQPASVVAKTALRVLQCRADKFAAYLDHNIRAKKVYVEAAKARKARMQDRGSEVERLMSLGGKPLLIDLTANASTCANPSGKHAPHFEQDQDKALTATAGLDPVPGAVVPSPSESKSKGLRHEPSSAKIQSSVVATKGRGARRVTTSPGPQVGADVAAIKTPAECEREGKDDTACPLKADVSPKDEVPEALDAERVAATAGTPSLSRNSLGYQISRGQHPGASLAAVNDGEKSVSELSRHPALHTSFSAGEIGTTPSARGHRRARNWTGEDFDRKQVGNDAVGEWSAGFTNDPQAHGRAGFARVVNESGKINRHRADLILASHLTPFPTITRNRSLHAVSQPIVRHSQGFADACRGESSSLGSSAWRVARAERYNGLVATADRLSIVRQIEAGFDALQGRRISPLA